MDRKTNQVKLPQGVLSHSNFQKHKKKRSKIFFVAQRPPEIRAPRLTKFNKKRSFATRTGKN